jgi:hypothetical protein
MKDIVIKISLIINNSPKSIAIISLTIAIIGLISFNHSLVIELK